MENEPKDTVEFLEQLKHEKHPLIRDLREMFEKIESNVNPENFGATRSQGEESGVERWFVYCNDFKIQLIRRNDRNQIVRVNDKEFLE